MPTVTSENRDEFNRKEMEKKNHKSSLHADIGKEIVPGFVTSSRSWWMDHAIANKEGPPTVARIEMRSTKLKTPSEDELSKDESLSPYHQSEDHHGKHVTRWKDLTEDHIKEHKLNPGKLSFPMIVDGKRPISNNSSSPVSEQSYRKYMDDLQNEGN